MIETPRQSTNLATLIFATGVGGEVHLRATADAERLTTAQGVVSADNQNSLQAGAPGPALLEDLALREKIFCFDHQRIPERVVHACGYGAHGTFTRSDAHSHVAYDVDCARVADCDAFRHWPRGALLRS